MSYIRGLSDDTEIEMPDDATVQRLMTECRAAGITEGAALTACVNTKLDQKPDTGSSFVQGLKDIASAITAPFTGPPAPAPGKLPVKPTTLFGLPRTLVVLGACGLGAVLLLRKPAASSPAPTSNPRRRRRR